MLRFLTVLLVGSLVVMAFMIYDVKYDSHDLKRRVAALDRAIAEEHDAIAVLRAEWSHLNRPARLERLARKHLGLVPLSAGQIVTKAQLDPPRRRPTQGPGVGRFGTGDTPARRQQAAMVR